VHIEKFLFFPYAKHRNWWFIFVKIKQKLFYEAKIAFLRFLQIISLALFFIRKKRAVKEAEKRAVLSLCQFCYILKLLSPPRVEILLWQNLLGTTANFHRVQIFRSLKNGAHPQPISPSL
jgi:hypothetical protein